jgi:hypothetical protein
MHCRPHIQQVRMDTKPDRRREIPMVLKGLGGIVWVFVCLAMAMWAVFGLICFIVGGISLFVERWPLELSLGGAPVQTTPQKALFVFAGAVIFTIGVAFWWLRRRGSVLATVLMYVYVVLLALALAWATGSNEIISIGWTTD